jgi:hypothetical protein
MSENRDMYNRLVIDYNCVVDNIQLFSDFSVHELHMGLAGEADLFKSELYSLLDQTAIISGRAAEKEQSLATILTHMKRTAPIREYLDLYISFYPEWKYKFNNPTFDKTMQADLQTVLAGVTPPTNGQLYNEANAIVNKIYGLAEDFSYMDETGMRHQLESSRINRIRRGVGQGRKRKSKRKSKRKHHHI